MTTNYAPLNPILNRPRGSHPPELAAALRPTKAFALVLQATRLCTQCSRAMSPGTVYNWCELCRQKDREKAKRKEQRALELARERAQAGAATHVHGQAYAFCMPVTVAPDASLGCIPMYGTVDTDVEMREPGAVAPSLVTLTVPAKRKVSEVVSDGALVLAATASRVGASPAHAVDLERTEYQTERLCQDALLERMQEFREARSSFLSAPSLAAAAAPPYVNFHGSFTIVMDPDVSAVRWAKQIKADLGKSAYVKFGADPMLVSFRECGCEDPGGGETHGMMLTAPAHSDFIKQESAKATTGHARTHWCACSPATTPRPAPTPTQLTPPASTAPTFKRTQSTLTNWLSKPPPTTHPRANLRPGLATETQTHTPPPTGCGGTIMVYVVQDASHPLASLGIQGQRIAVQVEHPGRDVNKPFAFE